MFRKHRCSNTLFSYGERFCVRIGCQAHRTSGVRLLSCKRRSTVRWKHWSPRMSTVRITWFDFFRNSSCSPLTCLGKEHSLRYRTLSPKELKLSRGMLWLMKEWVAYVIAYICACTYLNIYIAPVRTYFDIKCDYWKEEAKVFVPLSYMNTRCSSACVVPPHKVLSVMVWMMLRTDSSIVSLGWLEERWQWVSVQCMQSLWRLQLLALPQRS